MIVLALTSLLVVAASTMSQALDPPEVRQRSNGEFMSRNYPPGALRRGEEGRVAFTLEVEKNGRLASCQVTGSSGFAKLDAETCDFIVKYAKVKPAKSAEGRQVASVVQGFIKWKLPPGASRRAMVEAELALEPDKIICKSYARTGSRVGRIRQCMSRADWAVKDRIVRDEVGKIQEFPAEGCGRAYPC